MTDRRREGRPERGRWRLWAGVAGPVAFTAAWLVSGIRQRGYSLRDEHISGLAAPDARNPGLMIGGFVFLGGSMIAFARELELRLREDRGPGPGPVLLSCSGGCLILAGLLRRDRMANKVSGEVEPFRQSARNDWHDRTSVAAQSFGLAATLALSHRLRNEPGLEAVGRRLVSGAVGGGALALFFASETTRPWNGIVQRLGITVWLSGMAILAARMLARRPG